ncbi:MAG: hypothetical protein JNM63_02240, partial [Spirochaetia bacterium]|nr:hypothetical protein [Spirochaetia bacterium]
MAYPLLLSGIALLAALGAQALGMDKGLFGPAVASFMKILVGDFLGLTAWFLPLSIILSAFYLLKKDKPEILTRLPVRIFFLFTLFFSLNLVLLNVGLQDTLYAGLLPLFVHALVLHYLGSQGHATITSFGLEMLLLGFSSLYFTAIFLKKSPGETIQTLVRVAVLFFQRVKIVAVEILHRARIFLEEKKILVPVAPREKTPAGANEPFLRRLRPGEWPLAPGLPNAPAFNPLSPSESEAVISEVGIPNQDEEIILPGAPLNPEQEIKINRLEPEAVVGSVEPPEEAMVVTEPMLSGETPVDS